MYRYFLFEYDDFYPAGGMEDCVLKTNDYDELSATVKEKYDGEHWSFGTAAYYDAMEDKYYIADMRWHKAEDGWDELKFHGWVENNND